MAVYTEDNVRYEFDLKIRKIVTHYKERPYLTAMVDPDPEEIVSEDLTFKALSAVEVLRKLIDYLRTR